MNYYYSEIEARENRSEKMAAAEEQRLVMEVRGETGRHLPRKSMSVLVLLTIARIAVMLKPR